VYFGVVGSIPAYQQVLSAQLRLNAYSASNATGFPVTAYPVSRSWNYSGTVTWNTYDGVNAWTKAGGDYSTANAVTTNNVGTATGWYNWYPTQAVQSWLNGTTSEYGFLLKEPDNAETTANIEGFYSHEWSDSSVWPQLIVTYQPWLGDQSFFTFNGPVNVANGNMMLSETDLSMDGVGLPLQVSRTYNSLNIIAPTAQDFGANGWSMDMGVDLKLQIYGDGSVAYYGPSGYQTPFVSNGSGFTSPPSIDADLVRNATTGNYTLTFHQSQEVLTFDSAGLLLSDADRAGNTLTYSYDTSGRLSTITDTQGRTTTFQYTNTSWPNAITGITDPAGRTYSYGYGSAGNLTSYTAPDNSVTKYSYNALGQITQITDPNGNVTTIQYDGSNRVSSITQVTPSTTDTDPTTQYAYYSGSANCPAPIDPSSPIVGSTVVTDPMSRATRYCYDAFGRVANATDPSSHTEQATYNKDNQPTVDQLPIARSEVKYDNGVADRVLSVYDCLSTSSCQSGGNGLATSFTYDTGGSLSYNPIRVTDDEGRCTNYTYDSHGLVLTVTQATNCSTGAGYTTTLTRNANGTVSSVQDANNHTTSYGYYSTTNTSTGASQGLLQTVTNPSPLGNESFTYYATNQVKTATDGKGQTTTYTYDGVGRVLSIAYADGTSVGYAYDADGNVTSMSDATGTTTYTYNALNQLTKETLPGGVTNSYTYNLDGTLKSKTDSTGTVSYTYLPDGSVQTVTDQSNAQSTFGYDADGNTTSIAYPNGVTQTLTYNTLDQLTSIVGKKTSTGATLTSFSYSYVNPSTGLPTARRYSMTDTSGTTTSYGYDSLGRLTSAATPSTSYQYTYDPVGNITQQTLAGVTTTMTYNVPDELTAAGSTTYSYDGNGNETGNSAGLGLTYNAKNQTSSITPIGSSAISMTYRGPNQAQRTARGGSSFTYDATGISSFAQSSTSGTTAFTRSPHGYLIGETLSGGAKYYYLYDGLGSVVALTDNSGTVANTYSYDPYGNTTATTGSVSNPFRYIGGVWDASAKLYKLGERYYDPSIGRFTQLDPLGEEYQYAGDDPVNLTDPSGLEEDRPMGTGIGGPPPSVSDGGEAGDAAPTVTQRIARILKPGGEWLGNEGDNQGVRTEKGGLRAAARLFARLTRFGRVERFAPKSGGAGYIIYVRGGGTIVYRLTSGSGEPTIEAHNVPGVGTQKWKFVR
jgi:RHS repeat-associated protein